VLLVASGRDLSEEWLTNSVADLARRQDVVVVCPVGDPDATPHGSYTFTSQLRDLLPRRVVIAVLVSERPDAAGQEGATIASLVDDGAIAVAVARAADMTPVAAGLARCLRTRTLLQLSRDGFRRVALDAPTA
jgi:hypothetical protein